MSRSRPYVSASTLATVILSESAFASEEPGGYALLLVLFFIVPVAAFGSLLTGILYANWSFERQGFARTYKGTFLVAAACVAFWTIGFLGMEAFWITFFAEAILLVPILLPAHLQSRRARQVRWNGEAQVVDHSKYITIASALCWAWGAVLVVFAVYGLAPDPDVPAALGAHNYLLRTLFGVSGIAFGLGGFALPRRWLGVRWWVFGLCTATLVFSMISWSLPMVLGPAAVLELLIIAWRSLSGREG